MEPIVLKSVVRTASVKSVTLKKEFVQSGVLKAGKTTSVTRLVAKHVYRMSVLEMAAVTLVVWRATLDSTARHHAEVLASTTNVIENKVSV